jgi:hypothetical protein
MGKTTSLKGNVHLEPLRVVRLTIPKITCQS